MKKDILLLIILLFIILLFIYYIYEYNNLYLIDKFTNKNCNNFIKHEKSYCYPGVKGELSIKDDLKTECETDDKCKGYILYNKGKNSNKGFLCRDNWSGTLNNYDKTDTYECQTNCECPEGYTETKCDKKTGIAICKAPEDLETDNKIKNLEDDIEELKGPRDINGKKFINRQSKYANNQNKQIILASTEDKKNLKQFSWNYKSDKDGVFRFCIDYLNTNTSTPNELLTIKTGGNIGIGNNNPGYKLDVAGDIKTGNNIYIGNNTDDETKKSIYFGGTKNDNRYDHCVIERRVYKSKTEKQELLLFCGNDKEGGSGPDRIRLKGGQLMFDVFNSPTTDRNSENTKMIIRSNGNVGIGTTNPVQKLDINGSVEVRSNLFMRNLKATDTSSTPGNIYFDRIDENGYANIGEGSSIGNIIFRLNENSDYKVGSIPSFKNYSMIRGEVDAEKSPIKGLIQGGLSFWTTSDGNNGTDGLQNRMCIKHNGNVGIGTTNPGAKLHIKSDTTGQNSLLILENKTKTWGDAPDGACIEFKTLEVGNNTSRSQAKIVVSDSIWVDSGRAELIFKVRGYSGNTASALERMRISHKGNVGIGTADPGNVKLTVNGGIKAQWVHQTSDLRMKKNIKTLNNNESLNKVLQLKPVSYDFINEKNGTNIYGYIGQEVFNIVPEAIKKIGDFIPTIMKSFKYESKLNKIIINDKEILNKINVNKYYGIGKSEEDTFIQFKILEKDLNSVIIENPNKSFIEEENIYIYGEYLKDDIYSVNYNHINILNTGSIQELNKKIVSLEETIKNLINRIEILESKK